MGPFKIALSFRFQIEDAVKAARDEATEAYIQYVEEPKTSQRRGRFDLELESHRTKKGAIYRIHGNNNPKRVGHRVTGGCFVMDNADGLVLARKIRVGTEVNIIP